MKNIIAVSLLLSAFSLGCWKQPFAWAKTTPTSHSTMDATYREAQRLFHKGNYSSALTKLQEYVERSKKEAYKRERLFWVIDQIGRIYLRVNQNPDQAIAFFQTQIKDERLNDAEAIAVEEWIGAAKDWKKYGQLPVGLNQDQLYLSGKRYFDRAIKKVKSPRDDDGNADFHISATFLVPFIVNFDSDPRIGNALLMMGTVRRHAFNDAEYWSENFYLKEVIRRFPNTTLAQKAFEELEEEVHFGYTGSSGDNTPESVKRMLDTLRPLASVKVSKTRNNNTP